MLLTCSVVLLYKHVLNIVSKKFILMHSTRRINKDSRRINKDSINISSRIGVEWGL